MATAMVPDELIHVENNVILTTKDLIRVQQLFNYLSTNLDKFRVGSEFVVLCGVHGSEEGRLMEAGGIFKHDYTTMFRWFNSEQHYNDFSPKSAKPFQLVAERKYQMGKVIEIASELDESKEDRYKLTDSSKMAIKNEFERILDVNKPTVLVLASCYSFRSEISNMLRSSGLYSALIASEDRGDITAGKLFCLDEDQKNLLRRVANDEGIKDVIVGGEYIKN